MAISYDPRQAGGYEQIQRATQSFQAGQQARTGNIMTQWLTQKEIAERQRQERLGMIQAQISATPGGIKAYMETSPETFARFLTDFGMDQQTAGAFMTELRDRDWTTEELTTLLGDLEAKIGGVSTITGEVGKRKQVERTGTVGAVTTAPTQEAAQPTTPTIYGTTAEMASAGALPQERGNIREDVSFMLKNVPVIPPGVEGENILTNIKNVLSDRYPAAAQAGLIDQIDMNYLRAVATGAETPQPDLGPAGEGRGTGVETVSKAELALSAQSKALDERFRQEEAAAQAARELPGVQYVTDRGWTHEEVNLPENATELGKHLFDEDAWRGDKRARTLEAVRAVQAEVGRREREALTTTAQEVAQVTGVTLPAGASPERSKAALREAKSRAGTAMRKSMREGLNFGQLGINEITPDIIQRWNGRLNDLKTRNPRAYYDMFPAEWGRAIDEVNMGQVTANTRRMEVELRREIMKLPLEEREIMRQMGLQDQVDRIAALSLAVQEKTAEAQLKMLENPQSQDMGALLQAITAGINQIDNLDKNTAALLQSFLQQQMAPITGYSPVIGLSMFGNIKSKGFEQFQPGGVAAQPGMDAFNAAEWVQQRQ